MVGTYQATADWGTSTLTLNADHTFKQTVTIGSGTVKEAQGKWKLFGSGDSIVFSGKYLWITHDKQGEDSDGAYASAERLLFGGIEISVDPDYGIAFRK